MAEDRSKFFTRGRVLFSLVMTGRVFVVWILVLRPFVPELPEGMLWLASAYTAIVMTGVFYLALNMFMVVFFDPEKGSKG